MLAFNYASILQAFFTCAGEAQSSQNPSLTAVDMDLCELHGRQDDERRNMDFTSSLGGVGDISPAAPEQPSTLGISLGGGGGDRYGGTWAGLQIV